MVSVIVRNLTKNFGDMVALNNVSLKIEAGEMFFLLGPSGCGKTTLLRHIAGFYTPDSGHIFFDAKEVTDVPPHKRNTAMMFQSYALWPHMTVAENVAFGLQERKTPADEAKDRVQEALQLVQMSAYGERKINQLSGGQQQRVALARSMVVRPDCLLLDEPLSNLDTKLRLEMRAEIRRICRKFGLTAIYVTHDQKEALHLGDRMAIMHKGVISQVGTPREVYRSPHTLEVAGFIGEINLLDGTLHSDTPRQGVWNVETAQGMFQGRVTDPDWRPHAGAAVKVGIRPEAFRFTEDRMERNAFTGRLTDAVYLGEVAQYTLTDDAGNVIRISELNPPGLREGLDGGLNATVFPDDVMLLAR